MILSRTRIHSYVPCVAAIFEHCCLRSPLGYPSLANSASFCTALWCSVSASLAMRCTLSRAELRTARRCSNGVALSNRWYRHILFGCSSVCDGPGTIPGPIPRAPCFWWFSPGRRLSWMQAGIRQRPKHSPNLCSKRHWPFRRGMENGPTHLRPGKLPCMQKTKS